MFQHDRNDDSWARLGRDWLRSRKNWHALCTFNRFDRLILHFYHAAFFLLRIFYSLCSLLFYLKFGIVLFQVLYHNIVLTLTLVLFFLLQFTEQQLVPVLYRVLCPTFQNSSQFAPFLFSIVQSNVSQENVVLILRPWAFHNVWIKKACIMLTTLLGMPENFVFILVFEVQFFRN